MNASPWAYAAASGGIVDTADVAIKAAHATYRNHLCSLQIINKDASAGTEVVVKDGSTVIFRTWAAAVGITPGCYRFKPPLVGTANTALNVACITNSSETYVNAQGYVAP